MLDRLAKLDLTPSFLTAVASMEAAVLGLHNNTSVDMAPWEDEKTPDKSARTYDIRNLGFICAGHTSHSVDAGKIARFCCDVRIRGIDTGTIADLEQIITAIDAGVVSSSNNRTVFIQLRMLGDGLGK
jgi:hypothetical protein